MTDETQPTVPDDAEKAADQPDDEYDGEELGTGPDVANDEVTS